MGLYELDEEKVTKEIFLLYFECITKLSFFGRLIVGIMTIVAPKLMYKYVKRFIKEKRNKNE